LVTPSYNLIIRNVWFVVTRWMETYLKHSRRARSGLECEGNYSWVHPWACYSYTKNICVPSIKTLSLFLVCRFI